MKIGISASCATGSLGLDAGLAAIKAAGFEVLDQGIGFLSWGDVTRTTTEIAPFYSDDNAVAAFVAEITAGVKKHGLEIGQFHAPFPSYNPGNELTMKMMLPVTKRSIEITAACGCDKIVVHPCLEWDLGRNALTPKEEWDLNIKFYSELIPTLRKNRVMCCLENMIVFDPNKKPFGAICTQASQANRYMEALNDIAGERLFGICLDTGHLLLAGVDIENTIMELGENLVALHIHDNDGREDQHNAPYVGGIMQWDRFIRGLKNNGYKGNLSFETGGATGRYPKSLLIPALNMLGETAKYFRDEIMRKD